MILPCLLLTSLAATPEGSPLSAVDLVAYRAALEESKAPAEPVTFARLWAHPDEFAGKRVRVSGKVVRRFSQGDRGDFPPLTEAWIADDRDNPIALAYPSRRTKPTPAEAIGSRVVFEGTFLKLLRYRGGDVDRVAPLIVGPKAPGPATDREPSSRRTGGWGRDAGIGLGLAAVVGLVLLIQYARRPARPTVDRAKAPEFLEEGDHEGAG